jgi:hypothetical protein
VHRAHRGIVFLPQPREAAAALLDVAPQPAHEADIGIRVDEQVEIHLPAEALVGERQYHHGSGLDPLGVGAAYMLAKVILRDLDGAPGAQGALLGRNARAIAVVSVVIDDHDSAPRQPLDDPLRDGRFSRAGPSPDAEDEHGGQLASSGASFWDSRHARATSARRKTFA